MYPSLSLQIVETCTPITIKNDVYFLRSCLLSTYPDHRDSFYCSHRLLIPFFPLHRVSIIWTNLHIVYYLPYKCCKHCSHYSYIIKSFHKVTSLSLIKTCSMLSYLRILPKLLPHSNFEENLSLSLLSTRYCSLQRVFQLEFQVFY